MLRTILARASALAAAGALAATLALGAPAPASAAQSAAAPAAQSAAQSAAERGPRQLTGRALVAALVRTTADLTGQELQAVRAAVIGGQSLAQFAAANGSSGDAVVQAVADKAAERLDKAVESGRISRQLADALLQELTTKATALVNDTGLGARIAERRG